MHPNGLFVLTVGLCSFLVVCVAAGFLLAYFTQWNPFIFAAASH